MPPGKPTSQFQIRSLVPVSVIPWVGTQIFRRKPWTEHHAANVNELSHPKRGVSLSVSRPAKKEKETRKREQKRKRGKSKDLGIFISGYRHRRLVQNRFSDLWHNADMPCCGG